MNRRLTRALPVALVIASLLVGVPAARAAEDPLVAKKLEGLRGVHGATAQGLEFAPAVGVGLVVSNQLVFAKGFGYRKYDEKLPFYAKDPLSPSPRTRSSSPRSAARACW